MIGHREGSLSKEFKRIIPSAAFLGGTVVAAVAVIGDIIGAIGGGAACLMGVTIVQSYLAMGMMVSVLFFFQHQFTDFFLHQCRNLDTVRYLER
jgi:preprotein translocase subunit SecY